MSLDVYVIKPVKEGNEYQLILPELLGKFKEVFGDLVTDIPEAEFDWTETGYPEFEDPGYWETHDSDWTQIGDTDQYQFEVHDVLSGERVATIEEKDIKTRSKPGIYYEEVGHQRRGANRDFYDDGLWDIPEKTIVFDRETLLEHWKKYFSTGSIGDYGKTDQEWSKEFKKNIIDKFIEGKTFVTYS